MSIAVKRVKASQDTDTDSHSRALQSPLPERLPEKNEPSAGILPGEEHATSWRPVIRRPAPRKLILLEVMGGVWTFQDPENTCLYRCEIDPEGSERWFFKMLHREPEWISQSDAARLIGVSRQAIGRAIVYERLGTVDCNGRPMVQRAEVLGLKIDLKRKGARK